MKNINTITELLDSPIAYYHEFATIANDSVTAGILLSQLFHWAKISNYKEFSKTNEELQIECSLSRRNFDSARKILIDVGVISISKKGMPLKTYYLLNLEQLLRLSSDLYKRESELK